jgi:uncharacterized RDD family membrane protein YckC
MASANEINWNNWVYRLIAYIIDSIIISIVAGAIAVVGAISMFAFGWGSLIFICILGILYLFYYTILDTMWGATIGKKLMGLNVQTTEGNKLDFVKAFIRNLSKFNPLLLFLDWLIGIVTEGNKQQKFLDRAVNAVVIQKGQAFADFQQPPPPPPPPPT